MKSLMIYIVAFTLNALVAMGDPPASTSLFDQLRSLSAKGTAHGNPELEAFLKSMSPDDILVCARQGCDEARGFPLEEERATACGSAVVACMTHYFTNSDSQEKSAQILLDIISDDGDTPWIRQALIGCMTLSKGVDFGNVFRRFALSHIEEVERVLSKIINDSAQNSQLRYKAIDALAMLFDEQARAVYGADPNVRGVAERTGQVVRVRELVRAGELELAPETIQKLTPIEERILKNAALLARIATDENEPKQVRQHALRMLKSFQSQPLKRASDIDELVAKINEAPPP